MKSSEQLTETLKKIMDDKWHSDFSRYDDILLKYTKLNDLVFLPRCSSLTFYDGLIAVRKNSRSVLKKLKKTFSDSDVDFNRIIKYLNSSTSDELKSIYEEYNVEENNQKILFLIQVFIAKKKAVEWLANFLKNNLFQIFFGVEKIIFKRNVRFFFRKILSIHFKNLDDYHSFSIL